MRVKVLDKNRHNVAEFDTTEDALRFVSQQTEARLYTIDPETADEAQAKETRILIIGLITGFLKGRRVDVIVEEITVLQEETHIDITIFTNTPKILIGPKGWCVRVLCNFVSKEIDKVVRINVGLSKKQNV